MDLKLVAVTTLLLSININAATIVDTNPDNTWDGSFTSFGYEKILAAKFNVNSATTITGVEGWMDVISFDISVGTIAIYLDGGSIPGAELYSTTFSGYGFNSFEWLGANELSWKVPAGDYWVSFESRRQSLLAAVGLNAPFPLLNEAVYSNELPDGTIWRPQQLGLGVRIYGTPTIPVPAAIWLFGSGLIGLIGLARRKH